MKLNSLIVLPDTSERGIYRNIYTSAGKEVTEKRERMGERESRHKLK